MKAVLAEPQLFQFVGFPSLIVYPGAKQPCHGRSGSIANGLVGVSQRMLEVSLSERGRGHPHSRTSAAGAIQILEPERRGWPQRTPAPTSPTYPEHGLELQHFASILTPKAGVWT